MIPCTNFFVSICSNLLESFCTTNQLDLKKRQAILAIGSFIAGSIFGNIFDKLGFTQNSHVTMAHSKVVESIQKNIR